MGTYLSGGLIKDCPEEIQNEISKKLEKVNIWINTDKSLQEWVNNLNGLSGTKEDHTALPDLERPVTLESLQKHRPYWSKWGEFQDKIAPGDYYDEERANGVIKVLSEYVDYLSWVSEADRLNEDFMIYSITEDELQKLLSLPEQYGSDCKDFPEMDIEDSDRILEELISEEDNLYNLVHDVPGVYERLQDLFYDDIKAKWEKENTEL